MIEKKFVGMKKDEFEVKEFVLKELGKGRISSIGIERTPIGEKIIVRTSKPGLIIGRRGEKIADLTERLKRQFNMENPHIEIMEIQHPDLDARCVAEEIALSLERFGPTSFKIIAYKMLQRIKNAGALGAEIRLSGKLPSERAKSWRFAFGYLKKTGDPVKYVGRVDTVAQTMPGSIGVKVEIVPNIPIFDEKIHVNREMFTLNLNARLNPPQPEQVIEEKPKRKRSKGVK